VVIVGLLLAVGTVIAIREETLRAD
jgi:hypothetical protein